MNNRGGVAQTCAAPRCLADQQATGGALMGDTAQYEVRNASTAVYEDVA